MAQQTELDSSAVSQLPINERIEWLLARERQFAASFQSSESFLARNLYHAKHPTAVLALKCMDGRLNLALATNTPVGIIQPFRSIGGRFDLGWPYFGEVMSVEIQQMTRQGRRTLILINYHYSKGDRYRGCAGWNYDTESARAGAYVLKRQLDEKFGTHHETVYPLVCGFETDDDALILHGQNSPASTRHPAAGFSSPTSHVSDRTPDQLADLRARTIGFIFQTFNLLPVLSAAENLEYPLLHRRDVTAAERRKRVAYFLDVVGLSKYAEHRPNQLSGGQRQRVAIARALAIKPAIVLADEPTANLDHRTGEEILLLMKKINRAFKTTFIFSTHDKRVIARADRLVRIEDGEIAMLGVRSSTKWSLARHRPSEGGAGNPENRPSTEATHSGGETSNAVHN